ncbi:hypothetical protein D0Y65_036047, partial [Glycine soja]
ESVEGRCVGDVVNYPNKYMVHQICHDKQVLMMFHAKEFLIMAQELGAKTVTQKSSIENAKMIIAQPVPPTMLIEWIKKQKGRLKISRFWRRQESCTSGYIKLL